MQDVETLDALTTAVEPVGPVASTSARPDAHAQRYDRQLRLWGTSGQSGLEAASILVINGSATATQVLKNLVLPGIGSFTILDPCMTTAADIASNFFLEDSSLGQPRAAEAVKFLLELNDSVKGHAIVEDIPTFLSRAPSALSAYTLVISVDVPPADSAALAERCWAESVPMILARSCGFIVSFAVQVAEVAHIETHPPNTVDLRLDQPFPALLEYALSLNTEAMDSHEYGHIPSVVIVLRALEQWKKEHGGSIGNLRTFANRKPLAAAITAQKRQQDDENFDEAVSLLVKLAHPTTVPAATQALFDDPACEAATKPDSPPFWLLIRALRSFCQSQSPPVLPLTGSLPDIKATSTGFHALATVYRTKARQDLEAVRAELSKLGLPADHVVFKEVDTFVKHAAYLHHARGLPYAQLGLTKQSKMIEGEDYTGEHAGIFVALLATEAFAKEAGRWPGTGVGDADATADLPALEKHALEVLQKQGKATSEVPEAVQQGLHEIARSGGADLPQMAALNGGMIAQEAIKIVTRQYIPVNGMVVFDGVKSRAATFV